MPELPELLSKLATGASLSEVESKTAFEIVMSGQSTPTQIGALLMGMRVRGETVDEIAGAVGAIGAIGFSWAVAYFVFEMPWVSNPILSIGGIVLTAIIVAVTGVVASADVLRHKPLATLRAE